jgi:uncharacterized protein (DUF1800 family)
MSQGAHPAMTAPPTPQDTISNVGHLWRRAGFGGTPDQILRAARTGLPATITALIDYDQIPDAFIPPDPAILPADKEARIDALTQWWLRRMITTTRPLQEKMTLFWHGHFATANAKVRSPLLMYHQNQTFRTLAIARFDDLLTAVYQDPAMLIWLDGRRNVKNAPNENWGREVMELFTLGRGNYTEDDVHANARAFTGWRLDASLHAVFNPRLHDDGIKTLLGQTGPWGADDAVRILCAHPATGPFLAAKLWRFFASDQPAPKTIDQMARTYYTSNHSIKAMMRVMLSSPDFYGQAARSRHVKSPTDFLITTIRQLGSPPIDLTPFPRLLGLLGQALFNPPNVGGWPGGASWINGGTMLARFNLASQLAGDSPSPGAIDPTPLLDASNVQSTSGLVYFFADLLGVTLTADTERALLRYAGNQPIDSGVDLIAKSRGLIHLLLTSPEYQIA